MSFLSAISLFALVFVNNDLVATALFLDFSLNNGPLNVRRADFDVFVLCDQQDLIELHGLSHVRSLQKLVLQHHTFVHAVLFPAGFDHCIHELNTPIRARSYRSDAVISIQPLAAR